ncbi:hypothetical protein ACTHO0_26815, partial [Cytobacillus praedii]|uniref:hypothetical protein n=1 Tax=Cytobacillus praedii TaxID=1742358 RepID=UPI003F7E7B72
EMKAQKEQATREKVVHKRDEGPKRVSSRLKVAHKKNEDPNTSWYTKNMREKAQLSRVSNRLMNHHILPVSLMIVSTN